MRAIIGYWGQSDTDEKRSALSRQLDSIAGQSHSSHSYKSITGALFPPEGITSESARSSVAEITIIGNGSRHGNIKSESESLTASLSASGIDGDADISIRATRDSLYLRRDAFGRVTLFWTKQRGAVWFSTRLHLLFPLLKSKRISLSGLYGYSCFSYVPTPDAPVEEIRSVPAGTELVFARDDSDSRFTETLNRADEWREAEELTDKEEEARLQLRRLLEEAIESQLCDSGSESVGIFLSGGLDSSITAALLARRGVPVRAYALDFGEYGLSELPSAEMVSAHLRIPLVKVRATPRLIRKAIEPTARALDLPFGDGVTVPLYLLSLAASRECRTVFNGEGGDQLFAGWTNKPIIASGVYAAHSASESSFNHEYLKTFHRLHGYESSVFRNDIFGSINRLDPLGWLEDALDDSCTPSLIQRLRRANLMLKGAQNIEPRATNLAFANGLNVRTPFCYKPLARWSFQISGELFLRGHCEKYLLKRAVEDLLPSEIVWREKRGMGVPLTLWLLGPLWREVGTWLAPEILARQGVWQKDIALRIALGRLSGHRQGRRIGELMWLIMMWQVWRKSVFGEDTGKSYYNSFWMPHRWWEWRMKRKEETGWQL